MVKVELTGEVGIGLGMVIILSYSAVCHAFRLHFVFTAFLPPRARDTTCGWRLFTLVKSPWSCLPRTVLGASLYPEVRPDSRDVNSVEARVSLPL